MLLKSLRKGTVKVQLLKCQKYGQKRASHKPFPRYRCANLEEMRTRARSHFSSPNTAVLFSPIASSPGLSRITELPHSADCLQSPFVLMGQIRDAWPGTSFALGECAHSTSPAASHTLGPHFYTSCSGDAPFPCYCAGEQKISQ